MSGTTIRRPGHDNQRKAFENPYPHPNPYARTKHLVTDQSVTTRKLSSLDLPLMCYCDCCTSNTLQVPDRLRATRVVVNPGGRHRDYRVTWKKIPPNRWKLERHVWNIVVRPATCARIALCRCLQPRVCLLVNVKTGNVYSSRASQRRSLT
jgi:hypothetical protein